MRKDISTLVQTLIKQYGHIRWIRYLAAAGTATAADNLIVVLCMYILMSESASEEHQKLIRALSVITGYTVGLFINFWLSKLFVFNESELKTRTQFIRFTAVALIVLVFRILSVELLYQTVSLPAYFPKWFIDLLFIGTASIITFIISFFIHRAFSFKVK